MILYVRVELSCGCIVDRNLPLSTNITVLCLRHQEYATITKYVEFMESRKRFSSYMAHKELQMIDDKYHLIENVQISREML